jgi:outer membrane receptor protein involved in Fe transport
LGLASSSALAQQAGGTAPPNPAPPAASQLPEVQVIQKKAPAQKSAQKKSAPKKQAVAPTPQAAPVEPVKTAAPVAGTGGINSGTVNMSPVAGSEIPISKYPAAVGRASQADFAKFKEASAPEVLQNTVPGVMITDQQGNVYQRSLQYRGFDSSPVNGQAQGLAVYQNGVRINESFGDIVNWDFLPDNAIAGISILGANPVYGLNALGGAVGVTMRDGFNFQGVEIDTRFGSFGHKEGGLAIGARSGNWAVFGSGQLIEDDGFRNFSEASIRRYYGDIGVKGDGNEFHLNVSHAENDVGVTAAVPLQLLDLGWEQTFTSPQTTQNDMTMVSANGVVKATDTLSFAGVGYYRWFEQKHDDGNIADLEGCTVGGVSYYCDDDDTQILFNGAPKTRLGSTTADPGLEGKTRRSLGTIDRTSQDAESFGGTLQAIDKSKLFGLNNQFVVGGSYDHGSVAYTASSELGYFAAPANFVVHQFNTPIYLSGGEYTPRILQTTNDYAGIFFANTTDLTRDLSLTLGGRWNYARIEIDNKNPIAGEEDKLTGVNEYYRFNPTIGATYNLLPGLTLYGGYSEANRAPTAAELACADPESPCLIESFLTADPPLKQVVSHTFELGLRGKLASFGGDQRLEWTAGLFRTENTDDIIPISNAQGRGYFQNAGDTLRQGVELGAVYTEKRLQAYINYAFIDATFRTANTLSSPDNFTGGSFQCENGDPPDPGEDDAAICINVSPGDRLPGVPRHRFKIGADYWVTNQWSVGGDVVAVSDQVYYGDEGNDGAKLGGYGKLDLRTSYDITPNLQIFGMLDNVLDSRYGLFGGYFGWEAARNSGQAQGLPANFFGSYADGTNKSITPAPPVAAYGGLKLKY